jgi:hypothetical protein
MFKTYFGSFCYWIKIKHLLFSLSNVLILIVRIDWLLSRHKTWFNNSSTSTEQPMSIYRKKIQIYNNKGGGTLLYSTPTHFVIISYLSHPLLWKLSLTRCFNWLYLLWFFLPLIMTKNGGQTFHFQPRFLPTMVEI